MARVSYLLDTDILIDWLRGESWTKSLLRAQDTVFYCASITRKELLNMPGLKDSERQRILGLFRYVHVIFVDQAIATTSYELQSKYADRMPYAEDALIAATAFVKRLPLLTRNRKHFDFITEIVLADLLR